MKKKLFIAAVILAAVIIFTAIYFIQKPDYSKICNSYQGYRGYLCENSIIKLKPTMLDAPDIFVDKNGNLIATCGGLTIEKDPKCTDLFKLSCEETNICE